MTTMKMKMMIMMRKKKGVEGWAVTDVRLGGRLTMLEGGEHQQGVVLACHLLINNNVRRGCGDFNWFCLFISTFHLFLLCLIGSPGSDSGNSTDGFQLFITAASHRFSNLSDRHCSELFQSLAPPAPPKQFW